MRLQQYLNEETWTYEDMVSLIKSNCKPFLKDWQTKYKYNFLYSGKDMSEQFGIKTVRKNRKPLSTPQDIHEWVDDWFYKNFGVRARSNAVFGTFDRYESEMYGASCIIFPIGKYIMLSSNTVKDFYIKMGRVVKHDGIVMGKYEEDVRSGKINKEEVKDKVIGLLDSAHYEKYKLNMNEQMIVCKKYYLINNHRQDGDKLEKQLKEDLLT